MLQHITIYMITSMPCVPSVAGCKMSTNRSALWSDCEVRALIAVWGESNVQEEFDGAVRNKVVFVAISDKLMQQGYNRDWQQCRTKIKNLNTESSRTTMGKQKNMQVLQ